MDEIKETQKDNPPVETPDGKKEITPEQTPKTLEEQVAHIREAAFAEVGRYRVETEKAVKAAEAAGQRLDRFIKEQEEAETERYQDEPDKLNEIQKRRRDRERDAKLATAEQELSDAKEKVKEAERKESVSTQERNAREIATRLNVDPNLLAKLAKLTDGSSEAIEAEAQGLPKLGESVTLKVDSSRTIGGTGDLSGLSPLERKAERERMAYKK